MTTDLRPRRILLSTTGLELLRRRALGPGQSLPPGFALTRVADAPARALADALSVLVATGAAVRGGTDWAPHPSVADDLRVLAAPDLAVTVRASRPGLEVTGCVALSGRRGAALLRTGDTAVELSAFAARDLPAELARLVPARRASGRPPTESAPLDALLAGGHGTRLRGRVTGTLRATVLTSDAPGLPAGVQWLWDGSGWIGLEPLPAREGRPWVRLAPMDPPDLARWLAPLIATAVA